MLILTSILGAIMNRIRGGMFSIPHARTLNAVVFGIFCSFAIDAGIVKSILCSIGMFVGQSLGWGRYIGALCGWEKRRLSEVAFIDWFLKPIAPVGISTLETSDGVFLYDYSPKWRLFLWGFLGLTIRGTIWGLCIYAASGIASTLYISTLMGCSYTLARLVYNKNSWEIGEAIFGALLWSSIVL